MRWHASQRTCAGSAERVSLGVDVENDFEPKYITIRGKGDILANLRKEVKKADKVYLATDPDREGEAISWHLGKRIETGGQRMRTVLRFNEITKNAVKASLKNPRRDRYESGGCTAGAACTGPYGWLHDQSRCSGQK